MRLIKTLTILALAIAYLHVLAGQISTSNAGGAVFGLLLLVAIFYNVMLKDDLIKLRDYIQSTKKQSTQFWEYDDLP